MWRLASANTKELQYLQHAANSAHSTNMSSVTHGAVELTG
jgi:hypothetical protein